MNGWVRHRGSARRAAVALLLLLSLQALACRSATRDRVRIGWSERGHASWYGKPFHGRRTASGERYDMHRMTAAHRELPFGTVVQVRNLANDRRVQVTITDRGPFVRGRIIDLSYAAALELDMVRSGTAEVELRVIEMGEVPLPAGTALTVQVGAFQSRERAESLLGSLVGDFPDAHIEEAEPWFRVRIGTFASRAEAEALRQQLRKRGIRALVLRAGLGARIGEGL
jgi:rare lipoprotein A